MHARTWLLALGAVLVLAVSAAADGYVGLQLQVNNDGPGLIIRDVLKDGPAEKAGIKASDVLTKLDGIAVKGLTEFVSQIMQKNPGDKVKFTVERRGQELEISVTVGKRPAAFGSEWQLSRYGFVDFAGGTT